MSTKPQDVVTPTTITGMVVAFVAATLALLAEFGFRLTDGQQAAINHWLVIVVAIVLAIVAYIAKKRAVDKTKVVEQTDNGTQVTAGQANELPTGTIVRNNLGDLEPRRALDDDEPIPRDLGTL